jgi:hypothetical protein
MAKSVDDAKKKLDDEYGQVRAEVRPDPHRLRSRIPAGPDDVRPPDELEKVVKEVTTAGRVGSGAQRTPAR